MRESRLFRIVYYLLDKGQTTISQLAESLEVSVRTIYRDIDALSEAGIPVYAERGRNGGVRLLDDFVLKRELLSERERKELLAALQSLTAAGHTYDTAVLQKLSALFQVSSEEWYEVDFSRWGEKTQDNEKFELLKRAVIHHRCVRIAYAGTCGEESERTVWPLKLSYKSKAWYLRAWCTEKRAFRLFKLNRILRWELLNEEFAPPAWPEAEQKSEAAPAGEPKTEQEIVRLRFPKEMAFRVYDEFDETQVKREENGDFLVSAPMPVDAWVLAFLLSFGAQVEVLEPAYLRELLAVKVMELYEKYKA
ncbi:MAG: YafY family transcriptional regulator [Lachnospiraceae bacterium]|nr:YafY family transcriptional regulator [Lachnospiraceae bacterium]